MGFFDFLRGKKAEEKKEGEVRKELPLEEIEIKIREYEKTINDNSIKLKEKTKSFLDKTISSLKVSLASLKSVDLEKIKENEKIKFIVNENLKVYISHLEKLIGNLEELSQTTDLKDYTAQIDYTIGNFLKNSAQNHEKATILIGAEFEAIQQNFKEFSREFNYLLKENLDNKKKREKLSKLLHLLQRISDLEKAEEHIINLISKFDAEKKQKKEDFLKKDLEIKDTKNSERYKNDLKERRRIEEEVKELEKEIWVLQKKINFKELARTYHSDEKKHRVIKNYISNFKKAMEEDEQGEFAKILKKDLSLDIDLMKINEKINILSNFKTQSEIEVKKIEEGAGKIMKEIDETSKNKEEEEKKLEKFKTRKESLINELKSETREFF